MMHLGEQHFEQQNDCPSSPLGRKGTTKQNQDSYSTPKSKYKSVEKHAHQLINTPKPSSKKKCMFPSFETSVELPVFNDEIPQHQPQLHHHINHANRQLSTISENFDDDKENNQYYCNQNHHLQQQQNNEHHVKKLNLIDQTFQNEQQTTGFGHEIQNIFQTIEQIPTLDNFHNLIQNNNNNNNGQSHIYHQGNRLLDFFYMFNMKDEQIERLFDMNAQFEIINSGLNQNVAVNIMKLGETFDSLQIDYNNVEVIRQNEINNEQLIINVRGVGQQKNQHNHFLHFLSSAIISYPSNLITHIRMQFL